MLKPLLRSIDKVIDPSSFVSLPREPSRRVQDMFFELTLCLPLVLLAYLFYSYWRLRHIPGPFLASFSKLWLLKWVIRGELHIGLLKACEQYG